MLNQKQILEYAVKGIIADIEKLAKTVREGEEFIRMIDKGEKVKTPKTRNEIVRVIAEKRAEIEKLEKERFKLDWQISVEMSENNESNS